MLGKHLASSHRGALPTFRSPPPLAATSFKSAALLRVGVFGLVALASAFITSDRAEARRYSYRYVHHVHHNSDDDYSPQFSSIIVDGNSGTVLTSTSPDGLRHPASLTKVMTLYLLFERLDSGKITLDTEMPVSQHAADQDPTKLDLRPGQTLRVEDAIKGMVTRSANDAAVVVAEFLGGNEDDFAKMMTRKAHALGMSRTIYRNASGLPNDEQVTTARDQSTLGRAIQDRFPRYYRYFSTTAFNFRGRTITGHNHLLGSVEGVDGIKTGYTRASGFNLITSIHRGNRFLVGVVMGGRSGGSRDAVMRSLLAENLDKAATRRTVAAITERATSDQGAQVAEADAPQPTPMAQAPAQPASASNEPPAMIAPTAPVTQATRMSAATAKLAAAMADATAAVPPAPAAPKVVDPAPLTSGVIQTQALANIPGSSEPMKPVRVKTVQVKAGTTKLASAGPSQPVAPMANAVPQARAEMPETSSAIVATAETSKVAQPAVQTAPPAPAAKSEPVRPETARTDLPPQPPGFGTGNGILGVLPASTVAAAPAPPPPPAPTPVAVPQPQKTVAYAAPQPQAQPQMQPQSQAVQQNDAIKPAVMRTGWIVQVGALETEGEAQQRLEAAKSNAHGLLSKADSFTEPVIAKDNRKLFRARFAGLEHDQAEAVCRTLRHSDIPCITARN
jgi:D-alanyl-D-alanine carboxypeptidase